MIKNRRLRLGKWKRFNNGGKNVKRGARFFTNCASVTEMSGVARSGFAVLPANTRVRTYNATKSISRFYLEPLTSCFLSHPDAG